MLTDCRFDTSSIAVISYAGWGVAGTNVLFRLDATTLSSAGSQPPLASPPLHVEGAAPAPAPSPLPAASEDDGGASSWRVIVGVTVGVGGAALLVVVAILVVMARWAHQCFGNL